MPATRPPCQPDRAASRLRAGLPALALLLLCTCGGPQESSETSDGAREAARPRSLVVIVIDTLRRDVLPLGDEAGTPGPMPRLAARAAHGVAMRSAIAPSSWTLPSMTSLFTGVRPDRHGAERPDGRGMVARRTPSLAGWVGRVHGYDTALLTAGTWMGDGAPMEGFDHIRTDYHLAQTAEQLDDWLAGPRHPDRPYLLVLHSFEAHDPYGASNHPWPHPTKSERPLGELGRARDPWSLTELYFLDREVRDALLGGTTHEVAASVVRCLNGLDGPPEPGMVERIRSAYESGVRWVDGLLDEAIEALRVRGLLDDALLVVTSDHGEAFREHGILWHGRRLDDELIRVPLVMWGPPPFDEPRVLGASVGLIDLLPTWLDWAGIEPPRDLDGRSFLPWVRTDGPGRPVASEVVAPPTWSGAPGEVVRHAVQGLRHKVVASYDVLEGTVTEAAFDLVADPGEQHDLTGGTGVLPDGVELGDDLCEALDAMRARLWRRAEQTTARAGTVYGADVGALVSSPPTPCAPSPPRGD